LAPIGYHDSKQIAAFFMCAAIKLGLASRRILTNAAPVLPIPIDRHSLAAPILRRFVMQIASL
jgi:hypothetical protein